jgi:AraC-like DNA-binding protein
MSSKTKKIRKTPSASAEIFSLPLAHAALEGLRASDLVIAGIDHRWGPQVWGEGESQTHLVYMVCKGKVVSVGSPERLHAAAGELILVPGGMPKRLSVASGSIVALWFHLRDTPRWHHLRGSQVKVMPAPQTQLMLGLEEQILRETLWDSGPETGSRLMASVLQYYLFQSLHPVESREALALRLRLETLWQEVNRSLDKAWTVPELARRVHLSPTHFHRQVSVLFGMAPMKIVTRLRMDRAAALLRNSDITLDELAPQVGYETAYAFSDAFQRHTGMRPGAFRRS